MIDLRRMRFLMNRLPMARFRVEKAMAKATKCTSVLTGMPRSGGTWSAMDSSMELLEKARGAYDTLKSELAAMRAELSPYIAALEDPLERTAMELRYMEGSTVREIAYQLAYSEQHIFRVVSRAETKVTEKMRKDESHESC